MNGYNFTERMRRVLANATAEAQRWQHGNVGTEHLLLAISRERGGAAAAVLKHHLIDLEQLAAAVDAVLVRGKTPLPVGPTLPYTSRAKKVLEYAMAEVRDLGQTNVGTEYLLLGILREGVGIGAQVLTAQGLSLEEARATTRRLAGLPVASAVPPEPTVRRPVSAVTIDVQYADGSSANAHFTSTAAAIRFLAAQ